MPWPISKCLLRIVTVLSASIRRNTLGSKMPGAGALAAACSFGERDMDAQHEGSGARACTLEERAPRWGPRPARAWMCAS